MERPEWATLRNLIIVCGQSVYKTEDYSTWKTRESWFPGRDNPLKYFAHIRRGIDLAALEQKPDRGKTDDRSLLIFSGGQTRKIEGRNPISEAQSYWKVAEYAGVLDTPDLDGTPVRERIALEEYARDSFENLLFSICKFFACVGAYPTTVTLIGFAGKGARFEEHRKAISWPLSAFVFVGLGNPDTERADEEAKQVDDCKSDPLGLRNPNTEKRNRRNPFASVRTPPYLKSCPYPFEGFPHPHLWSAVLSR